MTLKNGFGKCSLFVLSPSAWKIKHRLLVFLPKKISVWRRHCSIGQSCCDMTSKRSIDWFLESSSGMKFFLAKRLLNQPKPTRVCIRSTNESNRSIFAVLFARFHFKVIRKLLYQIIYFVNKFNVYFSPSLRLYHFQDSGIWRVGSTCIWKGREFCHFGR